MVVVMTLLRLIVADWRAANPYLLPPELPEHFYNLPPCVDPFGDHV